MNKIYFRLVYNRKKKLNKSGKALIQVEAYRNRKKVYISTGIYVNPKQWDNHHSRIIQHPHSEELNRMLEEFILQLQWEELKSWKRGVYINLSAFKTFNHQNDTEKMTFLLFGRNWVEHSLRKDTTKKNLLTTLDLLNHFRPSIEFEDITYTFLLDFEDFMRQRMYETNTIAKHMRQLRTFVNEAIKRGYIQPDEYPFRKYQIKTTSNPQPIGFSGILLAKRQNSFYCTYFLYNRNVADTKSPYPIKRLEVIRWFNQKSMVFNQSLS